MSTHQNGASMFVKTTPAHKYTEIRLILKTLIDLEFVAIHALESSGHDDFRSRTTALRPT